MMRSDPQPTPIIDSVRTCIVDYFKSHPNSPTEWKVSESVWTDISKELGIESTLGFQELRVMGVPLQIDKALQ